MEGYIGEDGADNFQGVRTLEELDARYMEMAESENAEALDWENIVNQYKMARTFLAGMNAQENSQVQEASSEAAASPSETEHSGGTAHKQRARPPGAVLRRCSGNRTCSGCQRVLP